MTRWGSYRSVMVVPSDEALQCWEVMRATKRTTHSRHAYVNFYKSVGVGVRRYDLRTESTHCSRKFRKTTKLNTKRLAKLIMINASNYTWKSSFYEHCIWDWLSYFVAIQANSWKVISFAIICYKNYKV